MVVGRSEASAERPDQFAGQVHIDKGLVVGGDGGTDAGWKNRLGEKRLRPTFAGVSAE